MHKHLHKIKGFVQFKKWVPVLVTFIAVNGCTADINPPPAPDSLVVGAAIGAIGGGVLGPAIAVSAPVAAWFGGVTGAALAHNHAKSMTLLKDIENNGVQIFLIGDYVKLVLPTDIFFTPDAPSFNTSSFRVLDMLANFLNKYPKISVRISGYTDNQGMPERNLALSQQRAEMVANYLWNHGLDARLVYAAGYGSCHTVASNTTTYGRAANRRIEISLYRITSNPL